MISGSFLGLGVALVGVCFLGGSREETNAESLVASILLLAVALTGVSMTLVRFTRLAVFSYQRDLFLWRRALALQRHLAFCPRCEGTGRTTLRETGDEGFRQDQPVR